MIAEAYVITKARYKSWQNGNLLAGAASLDDGRRRADIGLFFGSIMATCNHLLWGDRLWLQRFVGTGQPRARSIAESIAICRDWVDLTSERECTDSCILAWATALVSAWPDGTLTWWSASAGLEITQARPLLVTHFFNHQTPHRGQLHAALTASACPPRLRTWRSCPGSIARARSQASPSERQQEEPDVSYRPSSRSPRKVARQSSDAEYQCRAADQNEQCHDKQFHGSIILWFTPAPAARVDTRELRSTVRYRQSDHAAIVGHAASGRRVALSDPTP